MTDRRRIIYTLKFTAKIYLYGPIGSSAIIRKVSADLYDNVSSAGPSRSERGLRLHLILQVPDKDDTYTYTETLEFF